MLEDGRRVQMQKGEVPHPATFAELIAYVSFQSAPRRSPTAIRGEASPRTTRSVATVLGLVAGDETKHYLFYRDLTLAAFAIDPSRA